MSPFYFGTAERRLFGIYEAARRSPVKGAAVLCYPWGPEYIHAHRSLRQLSNMLTAAGIHTLRFDYFGTGDSAGDSTAGDLDGWETDIHSAIEELTDTTGATQISLVGLRLGATLAANVAARLGAAVNSLVLWDPVVSGSEYLTEMHHSARTGWLLPKSATARPADQGGGHEILGFPLTKSLAAAVKRIDLAATAAALPGRTLMVVSQPLRSHESLERALGQRPAPLGRPASPHPRIDRAKYESRRDPSDRCDRYVGCLPPGRPPVPPSSGPADAGKLPAGSPAGAPRSCPPNAVRGAIPRIPVCGWDRQAPARPFGKSRLTVSAY